MPARFRLDGVTLHCDACQEQIRLRARLGEDPVMTANRAKTGHKCFASRDGWVLSVLVAKIARPGGGARPGNNSS